MSNRLIMQMASLTMNCIIKMIFYFDFYLKEHWKLELQTPKSSTLTQFMTLTFGVMVIWFIQTSEILKIHNL